MAAPCFLDEIGDMSLRTQSKVLRVLEEQRFEPVGSNQTSRVDVRVIAATNKDLEQEILHGRFRQDLFYRLNVIPFFVSPLRDRTADIPVLARHFLNEFSSAYGKKNRANSAMAPWKSSCAIPARQRPRTPQFSRALGHRLPTSSHRAASSSSPNFSAASSKAPSSPTAPLHEARSAYEREFILRKLQENRWNMTQTAAAIGLERSHLYRKMKTLGIAAPD